MREKNPPPAAQKRPTRAQTPSENNYFIPKSQYFTSLRSFSRRLVLFTRGVFFLPTP
jgi:hypothetical protein